MKHLVLVLMLSCVEFSPPFEREEFENEWWGIEEYSMCFNFHESGDLLSYQDQIVNEGAWTFHIPNEYSVLDKSIFVYETEECWEIEEYFDNKIITACECF